MDDLISIGPLVESENQLEIREWRVYYRTIIENE